MQLSTINPFLVTRCSAALSTGQAAEELSSLISNHAPSVRQIVLAVRVGEVNTSAMACLIILNDDRVLLMDSSEMTVERTPREIEILDILRCIKNHKLLAKTWFTTVRIGNTKDMEPMDAAIFIKQQPASQLSPDWQAFTAMFNGKQQRYGRDVYRADEWDRLFSD